MDDDSATTSATWQERAEARHDRARAWARDAGALLMSRLGQVSLRDEREGA